MMPSSPPRKARTKVILPKITKSGNPGLDASRASQRNLLVSLVEACLDDDSHIVPLYDALLQRQREKPVVATSSQFSSLSTVYAKSYEDFFITWIESVSDWTCDDLKVLRNKWSASAVFILAKLGLQYPAGFRFTEACRNKAFVSWLFNSRHDSLGKPLHNSNPKMEFKKETGTIDLSKGSRYKATYENGKLTKLAYLGEPAAEVVIDPERTLISEKQQVQDPHSDLDACFLRDPLPPEPLIHFFPEGVGPKQAKLFAQNKGKEWAAYIRTSHEAYEEKHVVKIDDHTSKEAKKLIHDQKAESRRAQLQKAKQTMAAKMKQEIGSTRLQHSRGLLRRATVCAKCVASCLGRL